MRAEDIPDFPEVDLDEVPDKSSEPRPQKAAYHYGTRSKAKGGGTPLALSGVSAHNASGKTGPGPPKEAEEVIIYLNGETGDLCRLARNKRTHVVRRVTNPAPLPAGTPASFSDEELMQMDADDVDRMLPKHHHQTYGHPMRQACEKGEGEELQDVVNRGVFGSPKPYDKGDIVIGLMWVYAIKSKDGKYQRTRGRITLMGNQERLQALIGREDAYAPVAQMITTRLLIAMHLGIPGIYFRKMDIKNAYINENMRRDVRCKLPPGYTI